MPDLATFTLPGTRTDGRTSIATKIGAVYVFLLFCRLLELLAFFGFGGLRLMLVMTLVALVAVVLTGNFIRAFRAPLGILLVSFTGWMIVSMPFSTWRSETLNQFGNMWLKSLIAYFITAGLAAGVSGFAKVTRAVGWATAAACVLVVQGLAAATDGKGDRLIGVGTLSNPNEIAFHFWLGIPFLILLATRATFLKKALLWGICLLELGLITKTLSREGLLLGAVVFVLTLVRVSIGNKLKLVIAAGLLCVSAYFMLSSEALDRYLSLFTDKVNSATAMSAAASSRARQQKLHESIELTTRHPIFGVGMGVFMPASVDLAKERGVRADWEVSHNSYTQVSSELGIPGLLLLVMTFVIAFRQVIRIDRAAKCHRRDDVRQFAFVLLLALVVLSLHFCFDSMAYVFYLPMVMGLVAAFGMTYQHLADEEVKSEGSGMETGAYMHSGSYESKVLTARVAASRPNAVSGRSPYRFGRRRNQREFNHGSRNEFS